MALETIAQADLYSTNDVFRGIVEEIIEDSPIFNFMPFVGILGNSLQYLRESTLPGGEFYNPGGTWTEGTPTVTQHTAALKILGRAPRPHARRPEGRRWLRHRRRPRHLREAGPGHRPLQAPPRRADDGPPRS